MRLFVIKYAGFAFNLAAVQKQGRRSFAPAFMNHNPKAPRMKPVNKFYVCVPCSFIMD
jgi:hypothetical protein